MKKDEFVDLMRQQGWTAEEVKEMVEAHPINLGD